MDGSTAGDPKYLDAKKVDTNTILAVAGFLITVLAGGYFGLLRAWDDDYKLQTRHLDNEQSNRISAIERELDRRGAPIQRNVDDIKEIRAAIRTLEQEVATIKHTRPYR